MSVNKKFFLQVKKNGHFFVQFEIFSFSLYPNITII